ncbi:MAG: hypothetical protein R2792_09365 [Saprospiraceae bacterium]
MISDIEFTSDGLVIIGMMDRTGHQFGYRQYRPNTTSGTPISAANGGDVLIAYQAESGWALEKNGTIPFINRDSWFGANTNQGPSGGEFFYDNTRSYHLDADAGGLVLVPGTEEVLSAVVNPNTSEYTFGGGVAYYSLLNGASTRNDLTIVDPTLDVVALGKASPIGDMEALCDGLRCSWATTPGQIAMRMGYRMHVRSAGWNLGKFVRCPDRHPADHPDGCQR